MIMTIADAAAEYVRAHRVERQSTALYSDRPVELTVIQNKWADATNHERQTIPLRNVAGVETDSKMNVGSLVWGVVWLFAALCTFSSSVVAGLILLLIAAANLANAMSMRLTFRDPSGGSNTITVSILEKDKLTQLAREIEKLVFADADQLRHEESMDMAQKQYTAQTNSVLIQQQMLANQQQS